MGDKKEIRSIANFGNPDVLQFLLPFMDAPVVVDPETILHHVKLWRGGVVNEEGTCPTEYFLDTPIFVGTAVPHLKPDLLAKLRAEVGYIMNPFTDYFDRRKLRQILLTSIDTRYCWEQLKEEDPNLTFATLLPSNIEFSVGANMTYGFIDDETGIRVGGNLWIPPLFSNLHYHDFPERKGRRITRAYDAWAQVRPIGSPSARTVNVGFQRTLVSNT